MKKYIYSLLTSAILMLAACTDNEVDSVVTLPETEGDAAQLAFTAKDFIPADAQSRTAITGNSFNWIQGDIIGILPDEGAQVYFTIKELSQDAKSAIFTGGAWGLKKANDYTAYYPFIEDIMLNREAVPVDYSEQSYKYQTNTSGDVVVCPSHDYMAAQSEKTTDGESLNFQFSHLGALVKVSFTLPEAAAVKRFYLSSDQPVFPVKGTFDLTPEEGKDVVITPDNDNLARTVAIHVEDLETTSADETVNVYFMMPPMSLVDVDLKVTGTVSGSGSMGGLIGMQSNGSITRCINRAAVTTTGQYAGGIVGSAYYLTISGCKNYGSVAASTTGGYAGGMSGEVSMLTITNCTNYAASITGLYAGYLVGYVDNSCSSDSSNENQSGNSDLKEYGFFYDYDL